MLEKALCSAEEPEFLSSLESDLSNGCNGSQTDQMDTSQYPYSGDETLNEPFIIHTPNSGSPVTPTAQKDFVVGTMSNSSSCMTVIERTRHDSTDERDSSEESEKCDNFEDASSSESLHVCATVIEQPPSPQGEELTAEDIQDIGKQFSSSDLPLMFGGRTHASVLKLCTEIVDDIVDQCILSIDASSEETIAAGYPCRSSISSENQSSPMKSKRSRCKKYSKRRASSSVYGNFSSESNSEPVGHNSESSQTMRHNSVSAKITISNTPDYDSSEVSNNERPVMVEDIIVFPPSASRTASNPSLVIDDSEITTEELFSESVTAVKHDEIVSESAQKCKINSTDMKCGQEKRNSAFSRNNRFEKKSSKTAGPCDNNNVDSVCIDSLAVPNIHHLHYTESLSTCSSCKSVSSIASDCEWDRER